MYYRKTNNVKKSENELLGIKNWERNIQASSNAKNAKSKSGYVYVICKNWVLATFWLFLYDLYS